MKKKNLVGKETPFEKETLEIETPFKKETLEKETYLVTGCPNN